MRVLLNRLLLWQKFALLGLSGLVLVAVPLVLYVIESDKSVRAAEDKVSGLTPARAVLNVVILLQQHRGLSGMVLAGNDAMQAQRAGKQEEVDKAIRAAEPAVLQTGHDAIIRAWQDMKERWTALPGKVAQKAISGKDSFAAHTELVSGLLGVSDMIVERFGLRLDPAAASFHLTDAALVHSPLLMETLGRMRARGSALLTAKNAGTEDRALMMAMLDKAQDRYDAIGAALDKAAAADPGLKNTLVPALQASTAAGRQLLQLTQEQIVRPEQLGYAGQDYFARATDAISAQLAFFDAATAGLERAIHERREALTTTKYALLGSLLLLCAAIAAFGYAISRSVTVPIAEALALARRVASGDLTAKIDVRHGGEAGELLNALKDMNASLVNIVTEVRNGTETIATASSQIAAGNLDLSSRTEQQAGSLEETAASMEEITGTVRQNADNARQANDLAHSASEVAGKGGAMVSHVVQTMGSINESSKKIVDIISVIDGIAFQTNILALNAAVEAARAGEQGRGFAVVAAEVRSLAQRAAAAAKEIKELISDSVEKVDAGARLVDQTGATMDEIVASIRRVSGIIAEITAAGGEQSAGIEQVNEAIVQMDEVTQQNASLVEQAAAAAESLQDQAHHLAQVVSVFRLDGMQATEPQQHATITRLPARRPRLPASRPERLGASRG